MCLISKYISICSFWNTQYETLSSKIIFVGLQYYKNCILHFEINVSTIVHLFPFKFPTLVSSPFLSMEIDFDALCIFAAMNAKFNSPLSYNSTYLQVWMS